MQFALLTLLLAATAAALPPAEGMSPNVLSLRATPPSDDGRTFVDSTGKTVACYAACYTTFCEGGGFGDVRTSLPMPASLLTLHSFAAASARNV